MYNLVQMLCMLRLTFLCPTYTCAWHEATISSLYGILAKTFFFGILGIMTPSLMQARLEIDLDKAWEAIEIDAQLGICCESYKWQQNQSHVEIYIHVPEQVSSKQVCIPEVALCHELLYV